MKSSSPGIRGRTAIALLAGSALSLLALAQSPATLEDPRQVYGSDSPPWLRAVGYLQVPGSRYREGRRSHYRENCSATLVARRPGNSADTIVTAWHCLEFYDDLSRPIIFTLLRGQAQTLDREAYRLADGGGMHADWAILRLLEPVPAAFARALVIHPRQADPGRNISMAGYSRDEGKGSKGERLTFDPACRITQQTPTVSDSDCAAYKGASGGAVIQVSPQGEVEYSGVISRGDSASVSTFVPVGGFRRALYRQLQVAR